MQAVRKFTKVYGLVLMVVCVLTVGVAMAQDVPWEGPLQTIADSFAGTTGTAILVIALVLFGAALALGAGYGIIQTALGIVAGGAIIMKAASFVDFFAG